LTRSSVGHLLGITRYFAKLDSVLPLTQINNLNTVYQFKRITFLKGAIRMSSLRNSATRLRTTVINRAVHPSQPDTPFCDTALQATPGGRQRVAQGLFRRLAAAGSAVLLPAIILAGAMTAMPVDAATPTKVRYEEVVRSILYMPMYVALDKGYSGMKGWMCR
jgi:hypothetical protein